ncbi:hypothetical protein OIU83_15190 [Flavobacterium sp. LS1R49]|uniref:Uncharacterized protein n=1 Tax=Flavobacterium shii TaxID=2987687 RepID=A0A9X3C4V1_9FLAO|nr:hypothetical protein [Flavobacterium shii]MCV9929009.1 hypothetical protein [Flavobacterium shii]
MLTLKQDSKNKAQKSFDPIKLIPNYIGIPITMKFGEGEEKKY